MPLQGSLPSPRKQWNIQAKPSPTEKLHSTSLELGFCREGNGTIYYRNYKDMHHWDVFKLSWLRIEDGLVLKWIIQNNWELTHLIYNSVTGLSDFMSLHNFMKNTVHQRKTQHKSHFTSDLDRCVHGIVIWYSLFKRLICFGWSIISHCLNVAWIIAG